jgi:hypothetical protein
MAYAAADLLHEVVRGALQALVHQLGRGRSSDAQGPCHLNASAASTLPREQCEASSLRDGRAVIARRAPTGVDA